MNSAMIASTLRSRRSWLVLQLAAGVLVGGIALFWAIRGLDASVVLSEVQHAEYGWIIVAFLCTILVAFIKVERRRTLYPIGDQPVPFSEAFSALLVTQMVNVIVQWWRRDCAYRFDETVGQPGATTLSTITVEKTLHPVAAALVAVSRLCRGCPRLVAAVVGKCTGAWIRAPWRDRLMRALREPLTRMFERLLTFRGWLPVRWRTRLTCIFRITLDALRRSDNEARSVRVLVLDVLGVGILAAGDVCTLRSVRSQFAIYCRHCFDARNYVQQYCAFASRLHWHCASDRDCGAGRIRC